MVSGDTRLVPSVPSDLLSLRSVALLRFSLAACLTLLNSPAFHPHASKRISEVHPSVFGIERISPDGGSRVLCLHNLSAEEVSLSDLRLGQDLLTGTSLKSQGTPLKPYQVLWVKS